MPKEVLLTKEGLEKLKSELKNLKENERKTVIARIQKAKEFGDLSENSEYEDAKNQQSFIEGRIQELESMIKRAKIVESNGVGSTIGLGNTVIVSIDGDQETYQIVSPTESDPINGKISSDSPVGQALIGKSKGDEVKVDTPDGHVIYKIVSIQ